MPSLPSPSSLSLLTDSQSQRPADPVASLTLEVFHNLKHQQLWTSLQVHDPRTLSPTQSVPLISGVPPKIIYTHPDEQLYMLEHGIRPEDTTREREWVAPTAQGQTFSLRRLAEIFDVLPDKRDDLQAPHSKQENMNASLAKYERRRMEEPWGGKRILLSIVNRQKSGDGTVVYYVVHEGTVKPRQN